MLQDADDARLLPSTSSVDSLDDRRRSSEGTSSSSVGCLGAVQEGFAEGIVSLKEAAVYIVQRENRCDWTEFQVGIDALHVGLYISKSARIKCSLGHCA